MWDEDDFDSAKKYLIKIGAWDKLKDKNLNFICNYVAENQMSEEFLILLKMKDKITK